MLDVRLAVDYQQKRLWVISARAPAVSLSPSGKIDTIKLRRKKPSRVPNRKPLYGKADSDDPTNSANREYSFILREL
jgi:hypothetical protein